MRQPQTLRGWIRVQRGSLSLLTTVRSRNLERNCLLKQFFQPQLLPPFLVYRSTPPTLYNIANLQTITSAHNERAGSYAKFLRLGRVPQWNIYGTPQTTHVYSLNRKSVSCPFAYSAFLVTMSLTYKPCLCCTITMCHLKPTQVTCTTLQSVSNEADHWCYGMIMVQFFTSDVFLLQFMQHNIMIQPVKTGCTSLTRRDSNSLFMQDHPWI